MKNILISGASGAIGSALVPLLLKDPGNKLKLLLRASCSEHLALRLGQLCSFWQLDQTDTQLNQRLSAVLGDVSQPNWGMEESVYQSLAEETTHLVHAAGNVKLSQSLEKARDSALGSVRYAAEFVRSCQRFGAFKKLEYLSTVGVAGKTSGLILEKPYQAISFHNTYEQAKAEAENFLLQQMAQGLPVTIHRPSMVVGDSQTGKIIHFQVFYHLSEFFCGLRSRGLVPDTGPVKLDIIPADVVAQAIQRSSLRPEAEGKILHLCSGPELSCKISDLVLLLGEHMASHGVTPPRRHTIPQAWFRRMLSLISPLMPQKHRRFLRGLPYFLDYLQTEQFFDNTSGMSYMATDGSRIPAVEDYLKPVMDYYWNSKVRD